MADRVEWMIYGANGHTGHLVAVEARRRGLHPVLAGREDPRAHLRAIADPFNADASRRCILKGR